MLSEPRKRCLRKLVLLSKLVIRTSPKANKGERKHYLRFLVFFIPVVLFLSGEKSSDSDLHYFPYI